MPPTSRCLIDDFALVDAPDVTALDPADMAASLHPAPISRARFHLGDDLDLHARHQGGACRGRLAQRRMGRRDDDVALAHQQALVDPAAGALPIADLPIVLVLADDLDRHALALEHPIDGVAAARAGAHVDLVGSHHGEARHRQAGALAQRRRIGPARGSHGLGEGGRVGDRQ